MGGDSVRIDPWSSNQSTDYARIIDQFGLSSLDGLDLPNATKLHRGGAGPGVGAQRGGR